MVFLAQGDHKTITKRGKTKEGRNSSIGSVGGGNRKGHSSRLAKWESPLIKITGKSEWKPDGIPFPSPSPFSNPFRFFR